MDVIDKARELGELIRDSGEMASLKHYEALVEGDEKAKSLMNDYKLLQIELVRATKEKRGQDIIDSIRKRLMDKQQELNDYETTRGFLEAKVSFDKLMKKINNVISYTITGQETCSPSKCGSCGGCK